MTNTPPPKALTHDEKKAADAAFAGRPFDESWSAAARAVYDGIVKALPQRDVLSPTPSDVEEPAEAPSAQSEPLQPQEPLAQEQVGGQELIEGTVLPPAIRDREAAIQAGTLSPLLDFPVLLALPPSRVPQPVPLFALIQPDPTHQANVTLLLPNEVSLSITSLN
jgi:hypothetical protein